MILVLLSFLFFIVLSAFFSASETALFSLSKLKLRKLSETSNEGKVVNVLLKKPTRLLSAIVFGNLLVNIGLSSLSTTLFVRAIGEKGLILAIIVSGVVILFFGEIFPKTFAIYMADKLSLAFSSILDIFSRVFSPLIVIIDKVVNKFSSLIIKRFKKTSLGDEEVKAALLLSKKDGQITAQQEQMISHLLDFKDIKASEILTARIDIDGIDSSLSVDKVLMMLSKSKHSKFPVYEDSLDNIIGILHAKDVFLNPSSDYHKFLRKPIFIPESKGIDDILKIFLERNQRIAVVLDEHGGTDGLLTLEDIIEEIFGEIYDEFESEQEIFKKIDNHTWRVRGGIPPRAINIKLGLNLPEEEDTIAGFILSKMEKIPKVGESIEFGKIKFVVERATTRKIVSVLIKK